MLTYTPGRVLVSDERKLVFMAIPKVALSSVKLALGMRFEPTFPFHLMHQGYMSFAIIREPVDRFVSGYTEVLVRMGDDMQDEPEIVQGLLSREDPDRFMYFLEQVEERIFDAHIEHQVNFLNDKEGHPFPVQKLFLMDRIHELEEWLGLELPVVNKGSSLMRTDFSPIPTRMEIEPLVTSEVEDRIHNIYKQDTALYRDLTT